MKLSRKRSSISSPCLSLLVIDCHKIAGALLRTRFRSQQIEYALYIFSAINLPAILVRYLKLYCENRSTVLVCA